MGSWDAAGPGCRMPIAGVYASTRACATRAGGQRVATVAKTASMLAVTECVLEVCPPILVQRLDAPAVPQQRRCRLAAGGAREVGFKIRSFRSKAIAFEIFATAAAARSKCFDSSAVRILFRLLGRCR